MKKLLVSLMVVAIAVPALAQNVPTRVAVIDVQRVLTQTSAGKAAFDKLKKMQDERIGKAQQMDEEVQKLDKEINNKKASLSEAKLAEIQKQLADKRIAMQRYAQEADQEIQEARDRELQQLEGKIKPIIDAIGKEMNLAAVFNKFESGLIYAADAIDITDAVVKRFDETTKK
ncbi:MAG: OmpH family outer membrane protein [Ignavibacteriae bacterium]|nr:OmpH family outer membrane protein [Ignavibacteriota bacterium]